MNNVETVTEMIAAGVDVNLRTEDSLAQTALLAATSSRMAALLLKAGADPRLADAHGTTVLHHTVLKEAALSLIPPLVAAGADVNTVEPAAQGNRM
jgi:ankyrin repeat protein